MRSGVVGLGLEIAVSEGGGAGRPLLVFLHGRGVAAERRYPHVTQRRSRWVS